MKCRSIWFLALAMIGASSVASADDVPYRIRAGRDYRAYSNAELQRRVFELEQAVMQLQQRIYNLEAAPQVVVPPPPPPWTCTVTAWGKTYLQTAASRGQAEALAKKQCTDVTNAMHCSAPQCSQ